MTYYGLYKITNLTNGKMYIGQHTTSNLDDGYMGSGTIIKRAIQKYGIDNFRKEWLMFCEDSDELNYMERVFVDQTWLDRSDTYNLSLGGEVSSGFTFTMSEETKKKISEANKGRQPPNKGISRSAEVKKKLSEANKGKQWSSEVKKKISEANNGRVPWNKGKKIKQM